MLRELHRREFVKTGALTVGALGIARPVWGQTSPTPRSGGTLISAQTTEATVSALKTLLDKPEPLADIHPQLNRSRPRVVFVASGGVFRGAFHIGMLAALKAADIKPDLIVGASVGTLMGAALGTMFARPDSRTLEKLVNVFLHVDEHVALTLTLKNAVREVGLRGRSIRLSPRQVRRMVQRGARGDPGFAATGAPAALVDAMSDLFLIPHRKTQRIVASFIAGDVTGAVKRLLTALRTETIRRLDVERAVSVSYTHLTLPTTTLCRSRWSPYH